MEPFCKQLYTNIHQVIKQQREHNKLSIHKDMVNTYDLIDLPEPLRRDIMSESSMFIPKNVVEHENIASTYKKIVKIIPESGTRIDITFLTGRHCVPEKIVNISRTAKTIELFVRLVEQLAQIHHNTVQIVLLPTVHKKYLDESRKQTLEPSHINTGVTSASKLYSYIFVYRYEEMYKTILHELLHLYNYDYYEGPEVLNTYLQTFKMKYQIRVDTPQNRLGLNECYNDALTICYYIGIFIALKRPRQFESFNAFYKTYAAMYTQVCMYLVKVSARLLAYSKRHHQGVTVERTHAFAYYHGKTALFLNKIKMFKLFKNRITDVKSIHAYVNILDQCLDSKVYKSAVNVQIADMLQNPVVVPRLLSLRMCNIDLIEKSD